MGRSESLFPLFAQGRLVGVEKRALESPGYWPRAQTETPTAPLRIGEDFVVRLRFADPFPTVQRDGPFLAYESVGIVQGHVLVAVQPPCHGQYAPFHTHMAVDDDFAPVVVQLPLDRVGDQVHRLSLT